MSDFRLYAFDLNTNSPLGELTYYGLTFDSRLGDAGAISFSLNLADPNVQAQSQSILGYQGEPFAIYVDLNGVVVWGGLAWTGLYTNSTQQLEIGGKDFISLFDQRVQAADYTAANTDPAALLAQIFIDAQNPALCGPGASIGLNIAGGTSTLPLITEGYPIAQNTMVSQMADDLIQMSVPGSGGLDLTLNSAWNPATGVPVNTLTIWSPRAGRVGGTTGLIFDLDSVLDWTWPTDATETGNTIIATGAGSGPAQVSAVVNAPGIPVGGLGQAPRLDKVVSYQSAQSQGQISAAAAGAANLYGMPLSTPTVLTVTGDPQQPLGTWIMGDDARLYSSGNPRFPQGYDQYWRIVEQSVTVADEGVPTVLLTFNQPPSY